MESFRIPEPAFDRETAEAVEAYIREHGEEIWSCAQVGFGHPIGCDPKRARLYCAWQALHAWPGNGLLMLYIAEACWDSGDLETAEAVYGEIDHLGRPGLYLGIYDEKPHFFLGILMAQQDRWEEAAEAYRRAIIELGKPKDGEPGRLGPDVSRIALVRYHLASVLQDSGMWDEAIREYETALREIDAPPPPEPIRPKSLRINEEWESMKREHEEEWRDSGRAPIERELARARRREPFSGERDLCF